MTDQVTNTGVQTPQGVPSIPAGQQLGGAGTQQNQAQQQQEQPAPVAPESPLTPHAQPTGTTTPQEPPEASEQPPVDAEKEQLEQDLKPNETRKENPYKVGDVQVGDSFVDTSINYMAAELGVEADAFDAVYENAIKHGDLALINPDALGVQLTPEKKAHVVQLATAAVQQHNSAVQAAKQEIYSVAGSEEQWTQAVQAFNSNAKSDAMDYAKYLADTGKLKQAAEYVLQYNQQQGLQNVQNQAPVQGGTGSVRTGLSKVEYAAEISKLELSAGNRSLGSGTYKAQLDDLNARRALGRSQGL
ncbi:scaffold protein [Vibrio phage vB_VhaP_VH-5]|uniref:Scaffold protein n=1 Tax=Vibrio phage vB_VhaP_VH-5 TaxID=2660694 RepID=A0A5Q2WCN6_9CAUD|nr:scaffold protein [Vibrio phage vB_VhaP_VH-5]